MQFLHRTNHLPLCKFARSTRPIWEEAISRHGQRRGKAQPFALAYRDMLSSESCYVVNVRAYCSCPVAPSVAAGLNFRVKVLLMDATQSPLVSRRKSCVQWSLRQNFCLARLEFRNILCLRINESTNHLLFSSMPQVLFAFNSCMSHCHDSETSWCHCSTRLYNDWATMFACWTVSFVGNTTLSFIFSYTQPSFCACSNHERHCRVLIWSRLSPWLLWTRKTGVCNVS